MVADAMTTLSAPNTPSARTTAMTTMTVTEVMI
jgi:hypothetical protein